MRTLQKRNLTNVEYEPVDGRSTLVFSLAEEAFELPETHKLVEMLRLTPNKRDYPIVMNEIDHNPNVLSLRTRSVMGLLYYLSQSVEVSKEDAGKGKLTTTRYADGRPLIGMTFSAIYFKSNQALTNLLMPLSVLSTGDNGFILMTQISNRKEHIHYSVKFSLSKQVS